MKNLKKNLGYQTLYQILVTITPLITAPYLARKLGADSLGIYSFTYSITNYFILFAMLGFVNYGTRSIAMSKNKKEESKNFFEIYTLQLFFSILSTIFYFVVVMFENENKLILFLQSFWLISCLFDVSWYFFGKEEFKTTVVRNTIIKLLTICCIFLFVKSASDLWKYTFIMSFGNFLSQFYLWVIIWKRVDKVKITFTDIKKHIKPTFILFVPLLAMSVYHIMDKTMLGILSTFEQSGFYYNSDKVINIPLGIITGFGVVLLPKMSSLNAGGQRKESIQLLRLSINGIMWVSIAMAFGIAGITKDFVPLFFGKGYDACILLIVVLSGVIIFKTLSNILRTQYMIPYKKENIFIISVVIGAIVNFISNYIMLKIYNMGALGAVIGTLIAECIVCILQIIMVERDMKVLKVIAKTGVYLVFGLVMFIVIRIISKVSLSLFLKIILEIFIGGFLYLLLSFIYWKFFDKEILYFFKTKKLNSARGKML